MAWDMEDMGAVMFIPVVFCLHIVLICLYTFTGMTHRSNTHSCTCPGGVSLAPATL